MMRRYIDLVESPLADFGTFGDMDVEGSFRPQDLKAMSNPKWQLKVKDAFARTPFDFNVYLYNGPDGKVEMHPTSKTPSDRTTVRDSAGRNRIKGIRSIEFVEATIGRSIPNAGQSITILLVENEGDDRLALTPWILAHRVCHAILESVQDRDTYRALSSVVADLGRMTANFLNMAISRLDRSGRFEMNGGDFDARVNNMAKVLAKFRSGREGKLSNPGEFLVESMTQYLLTGRVLYNRPELSDEGRTHRIENDEDRRLRALIKKFGYNRADFLYYVLANDETYRPFAMATSKRPAITYIVQNDAGEVVSKTTNADRAEVYRERGYTVTERQPSKALLKKWKPFLDRERELTDKYNSWVEKTPTDRFDIELDEAETEFEDIFERIFKLCVGKALVL